MKYIDIHCHLNLDDFNLDLQETIERSRESEVGMIVVGTGPATSKKAIKLAEENEDIWAIVGLHPADVHLEVFDPEEYRKLALHPRVVGIGEVGFDFYRPGQATYEVQKEILLKQIMIANEVKKPIMLHLRNNLDKNDGVGDVYDLALDVLKKHARVPGEVHFFAGTLEQAHQFIDLGFRISFTGVITFVRDYDEIIKNIPLNMIMSETDAPFVTPLPYRGQRNEPSYVVEVAQKIAAIRGESEEKVLPHLVDNARKLFSI